MALATHRTGHSRRAQYSIFVAYVLAIAGATIGVLLLALAAFDPGAFATVRRAVAEIVTPVSSGADAARRGAASFPQAVGAYFHAGSQNRALRARLDAQTREIRQARAVLLENVRLKRMLRLREGSGDIVTTARIVSSTGASVRRYGTLNAGTLHGVHSGQPVLGPDGLIGRVIEAGPGTARVMLVTDSDSVIPVRRTSDGLPAFAYGHGDGLVEVRAVSTGVNAFRRGDVFVTSGAGGIFPAAVPLGRIVRPLGDTALARPFADPDALDFATVRRAFVGPAPAAPPAPGE